MLSNQTSRVYCDVDELNGLRSMADRLAQSASEDGALQHAVAYEAVANTAHILATMRLNYPRDFMVVFERLQFGEEFKDENE